MGRVVEGDRLRPTRFAVELAGRGWWYQRFVIEYRQTSRRVLGEDLTLTEKQFKNWVHGRVRTRPYPRAAKVLEVMFPPWSVTDLLAPPTDSVLADRTPETPLPSRRPLGAEPAGWNIAPAVQGFRGREGEIDAIGRCLGGQTAQGERIATAAVHGIAGVGKTQLARAYADASRSEYRLGWWVSAETDLDLTTGLGRLALRLGAVEDWSPAELLHFVVTELGDRDSWLLIFDNARAPAAVEPFLPRAGNGRGGHVLVTSRNPSWRLLAEPIAVDVLGIEAATDLLHDPTSSGGRGGDRASAQALASELGRLPLAIGQAAAYAADTNITCQEYLSLFRRERVRLLDRGVALAYPGSVATSVALALDHVAATSVTGHRLLEICALLSPEPLPLQELLTALDDSSGAGPDHVGRLDVIRALRQSGLLMVEDDDSVRLHRMTQVIVEDRIDDRPARVAQAVALLESVFPKTPSEPGTWPLCAQLTPHARALLAQARRHELARIDVASLLSRVGRYLLCSGLSFSAARDLHERALRMRQTLHPGDHPETARCIAHLAVDVNELGDTEQACGLHEQALAMRRRLYLGDHVDLAHSLDNLGNVLHLLGDYELARDHHGNGLRMRRHLHSDDHPNVAYSLSNLAADLNRLGDLDQARSLNEAALGMRRRLNPGDHPDTAHSLSSLSEVLHALGEYRPALELDGQALAMRRRLYPAGHPDVVKDLRSLAENHRGLGRHAAASQASSEADRVAEQLSRLGREQPFDLNEMSSSAEGSHRCSAM